MDRSYRESTKVEGRRPGSVADQAAMFRVLQDCSEGQADFAESLLEALERHLDLRHSVCFSGPTCGEALLTSATAARGRARSMCRPYIERYAEHDIFRTPIAERRLERTGAAALWEFTADDVTRSRLYVEEFLGRFGMPWVFGVKIEAPKHVPLFVSILTFEGRIPQADMNRLLLLRRLLGPQLAANDRFASEGSSLLFTTREEEIAKLIKRGYSNDRIASALGLKVDTVKKHLTSMFLACGVNSRMQLAIVLHSRAQGS